MAEDAASKNASTEVPISSGTKAFITVIALGVLHSMSQGFLSPTIAPYGKIMGASINQIALFSSVQGAAGMLSNIWMPKLCDSRGHKITVVVALLGSVLACFLQGIASRCGDFAIPVFFAGRATAGFFNGLGPVFRSYVSEISMPDVDLMKKRMSRQMVCTHACGMVLSPLGGLTSKSLGLEFPFLICMVCAFFGSIWTFCCFVSAGTAVAVKKPKESEGGSWLTLASDPVVILLFVSYLVAFLGISGLMLLVPSLLEESSFGLIGMDADETQRNIAKVSGMTAIPNGLMNVFSSIVLFPRMSRLLGDSKMFLLAGMSGALVTFSMGHIATEVWHLYVLNAMSGLAFGMLMPALGPLMARYASLHFPAQQTQAQGIPMLGLSMGMAVGQPIAAKVFSSMGKQAAWSYSAGCITVFVMLITLAAHHVKKAEDSRESADGNDSKKTR